MTTQSIRPAFNRWPDFNRRLRDAVAAMTDDQLALRPAPDRWPLWATVGHLACQRVSGICGLLGEPGAESTPFPDALYRCPGDEYLEPTMTAVELADALDSTFAIVERSLDTWTFDDLAEEVRRTFGDEQWARTRGWVLQGSFAHDAWHTAELNESFIRAGLPPIPFWE